MPSSSGRNDHPCRATRPARSRRRRGWFGHGKTNAKEKGNFGRFLDDVVYAFADVSVPLVPFLWFVMVSIPNLFFGVKASALVAWTTMVVEVALIRGGWLSPLGTETPGWVSLTPSLLLLRLIYFNTLLAVVAYGGGSVAKTMGLPLVSIVVSVVCAGIGVGVFPRLAELYCDRFFVSGVRPNE